MDRNHNFYIPDYMSGFNIQKIDGVTDSVTIISGLGYTDTGDGGQATASQISCYNLACNRDGDVYLSDLGRVLVRKIDRSTGLLNTIAGNGNYYVADGDPSINGIITPYNMAADPAGNLFVMDKNRIRKIDAGTGIIHTVAGTGALGFSGDGGPATNAQISNLNYFMVNDYSSPIYLILGGCIAVDASGNIYFTDAGNQRVRKVDALTGNISTIAGCGTSGFSGDGGPATLSQLYYPTGIAVDSVGNIYIADNGRIRKIDAPTGNINTIALNINATSLALDLYNNIYFSQTAGNLIGRLHITTGIVDTIAGNGFGAYEQYGGYTGDGGPAKSAALYVPTQVCLSQNDDVLFTDTYNNRVRVVDHTSGNIYTLAGNGYGASTFVGWVCGAPEITFLGGGFTGDGGLAIGAELYSPTGVCTDASGSVYIADQQNYRIRKVLSPTAAITTNKANPSINLYPNPTNGLVNIKNTSASPLTYTVYNELGEKIGGQSDSTNPLSQLDLSQFPDGVYFMACSVNGVVSMHQLVVSH